MDQIFPIGDDILKQEPYFNLHILLTMFGFFLPNAIAAGAFRFFTFIPRPYAKIIHGVLNTIGLLCALAGFTIAYKHEWEK